jgi:uncharacterized protein (DUF1015 family)
VPRFDPFVGLRYGPDVSDLSGVICPPYDVISPSQQKALEASNEANCVRLELPRPDGALDRYAAAAATLAAWRSPGGPLAVDDRSSFYVYRMAFTDEEGRPRQTTGVLGALGLEPPGEGIRPHEQTTPKDKADRLDLLRATRTNLSPIWGLSLAAGLSSLFDLGTPPDATATDGDGVHHMLWRVTEPGVVEAISATVGSAPVVVADGHHRFEVALAYQAEQRAAGVGVGPAGVRPAGGGGGSADALLALIVELAEDELAVAPIHRLLTGLTDGWDPVTMLEPWFEVSPTERTPGDGGAGISRRMREAGALCLVSGDGAWLLRPTAAVEQAAPMDLDSSRLAVALGAMAGVEVRYQHGVANVLEAVASGAAQAGVLLRPATVAQIAKVAARGERMPAKTTFFTPKPATGMVLRGLDDQG